MKSFCSARVQAGIADSSTCSLEGERYRAKQAAEKVPLFVILGEAKNPSWIKTKD
jgi:hypothetical protein